MAERRPDRAREHRLHDRFRGRPRASPVRFQVSRPADRKSRGWARGVPLAGCRFPGPARARGAVFRSPRRGAAAHVARARAKKNPLPPYGVHGGGSEVASLIISSPRVESSPRSHQVARRAQHAARGPGSLSEDRLLRLLDERGREHLKRHRLGEAQCSARPRQWLGL
jgi:hypothetical protein